MKEFSVAARLYHDIQKKISLIVGDPSLDLLTQKAELQTIINEYCESNAIKIDKLYPLVAWIDEQIQFALHERQSDFKWSSMQQSYFNNSDAGDEFYRRLEQIISTANSDGSLVYYYLSICFGFKGKYFSDEDEVTFESLRQRILCALLATSDTGGIETSLPDSSFKIITVRDNIFWSKSFRLMLPFILVVLLYLFLREQVSSILQYLSI